MEEVFGPIFKAIQNCAANILELRLPRPELPVPVHRPCCSLHSNCDGKLNFTYYYVKGGVVWVGMCVVYAIKRGHMHEFNRWFTLNFNHWFTVKSRFKKKKPWDANYHIHSNKRPGRLDKSFRVGIYLFQYWMQKSTQKCMIWPFQANSQSCWTQSVSFMYRSV